MPDTNTLQCRRDENHRRWLIKNERKFEYYLKYAIKENPDGSFLATGRMCLDRCCGNFLPKVVEVERLDNRRTVVYRRGETYCPRCGSIVVYENEGEIGVGLVVLVSFLCLFAYLLTY